MNIDKIVSTTNDAAAGIAAGVALGQATPEIIPIGNTKIAFVPAGLTLAALESHLPAPSRLKQAVILDTPAAFAAYINLFGVPTASMIFAKREGARIVAALDYHADPSSPSWIGHTAVCTLKPRPEWTDWDANDGEHVDQESFASFIEEHIGDIAEPDGASLLEMVENFTATKDVNFVSSTRRSDGMIQFAYNEDVQAASKGGTMKVPTTFKLYIKPFEGSPAYELVARLRYRIPNGKLELWYDLLRPDLIVDQAFEDVVSGITDDTKGHVRAVVLGNI